MKLSDFQEKIVAFDWRAFESFVADVLRSTKRFKEIRQNVVIAGRQIDMVAIENNQLTSEPIHIGYLRSRHIRTTVSQSEMWTRWQDSHLLFHTR